METKRCAASIVLMMLSLLAVAMEARVAPDDSAAMIHLHTDGKEDVGLEGHGNGQRPYDCCNMEICVRTYPPRCLCTDKVKSCSKACQECVHVWEDIHVCRDWYQYDLEEKIAPKCDDY